MLISKAAASEILRDAKETVYLTVGWRWKDPSTKDVPMRPADAVDWLSKANYAAYEVEHKYGQLRLNAYTSNDLM